MLVAFLACMMQSGSSVHLQTSKSALTFAVQDSGIGIPNNDMPRLFEKFYHGTNREALVERHGGKVWVESESGKGSISTSNSTFTIKGISARLTRIRLIIQKPHY